MTMLMQMPIGWQSGGHYLGMHWGFWLFWIVAIAILLWAFWALLAEKRVQGRDAAREERAEELLRERFARGELDEDQFETRLRALRESRHTAGTP